MRCEHKRARSEMVGKWCPDCGAWLTSGKFTDEDGACYDDGPTCEEPRLLGSLRAVAESVAGMPPRPPDLDFRALQDAARAALTNSTETED